MNYRRIIVLLGLISLAGGGCASVQELTRDLPGVKRVKYTMAGAERAQRASLERGLRQLDAGEYHGAARSLRRAMWDVEEIDKPWLRLEELIEVHQALAGAYAGLGKNRWSDEQWAVAQALIEYGRRENGSGSAEKALAKAKATYKAAQFHEAVVAFNHALVELEGLSPTPVRLKALEDARCHLVLAYYALGQPDRAIEEVRRLAARGGATVSCRRQAPPPIQELIRAVETSETRNATRSAD
jgi:tetratricopeptide (TPR) repeat protein